MGRGDQPASGNDRADSSKPEQLDDSRRSGLDASKTLLLAAADDTQPRTWSRNDGGRYFDQPQGNGRPEQAEQAQWTKIPTVGGNTVRIDPRGNMVDVLDSNGKPLGRGRMMKDQPTQIMIGDVKILVNPDLTVDVPSEKGLTRTYPTYVSEYYDRVDNTYRIANRRFPDGSYENYANGRLSETNYEGFVTKFDGDGRKTEVSTPQGDKYNFHYGANGKVDRYEVTKLDERKEIQLIERGNAGPDGNLRIERRQNNGAMALDDRLINRTDVAIRSDLKLDYLDKNGYSLPDANGRLIKRDDRTVMASAEKPDGTMAPYPVNPIRSIQLRDGRQIDYEYASDKVRGQQGRQGPDTLLSYTVRDPAGRVVDFGQRVPEIPDSVRRSNSNTAWLEFRAPRGQSLPEDKIARIKQLTEPADPSQITDARQQAAVRQRMMADRATLVQEKSMEEFMPKLVPGAKGRETVDVAIDQVTGKQYNVYGNGETRVRNERGQEFISSYDQNTGDSFETYGDGTTYRRPWDADPKKHPLDRTTVTVPNAEGVPRVVLHHSRRDESFINVNYDSTGKIPTEIIVTPPKAQPIKMAPGGANSGLWMEYTRDGENWKPTGREFPMHVDLIGNKDLKYTSENKPLPAGTIVISQGDKRRIITPAGEEIVGRVGATPSDTVPERPPYLTPPLPQLERQQQPPGPNWRPPQGQPRNDGRPRETPQQPQRLPERPRMPTRK